MPVVQGNGSTQGHGDVTSGSSIACNALGSTPTAGNILIAFVGIRDTNQVAVVSSLADSGSKTTSWTKLGYIKEYGASNLDVEIWGAIVVSGTTTSITVTLSTSIASSNSEAIADIFEISGYSLTVDKSATNYNNSGASIGDSGTTASLTNSGDIILAAIDSQDAQTNDCSYSFYDGANNNYLGSLACFINIPGSTTAAHALSNIASSNPFVGCVVTLLPAASTNPQYITQTCTVDSVADVGTHSSFANEQATDSTYDTLTEANTVSGTTNLGSTVGSGSSYATLGTNAFQGFLITPANSGTIGTVTVYLQASSSSTNAKAIITDASGNILTNGISNATSVTTTAGNFSFTFATPPIVAGSTNYRVLIISAGASIYMYYNSTTGGTSYSGSNTYTSPTTPVTESAGTYTWRYAIAVLTNKDYQLMLEEQFTSVAIGSYAKWYLQVATGTFTGGENLLLDYWNGSSWVAISSSLTASTTNIFDVTSIIAATFTIRFRDQTHGDTSQNTWQIDSVFLVGANSVAASGSVGVHESGGEVVTALSSVAVAVAIHAADAGSEAVTALTSVPVATSIGVQNNGSSPVVTSLTSVAVAKSIGVSEGAGEVVTALTGIACAASIGMSYVGASVVTTLTPVTVSMSIGMANTASPSATALTQVAVAKTIGISDSGVPSATALTSVPVAVAIHVTDTYSNVVSSLTSVSASYSIGVTDAYGKTVNALVSVASSGTIGVSNNGSPTSTPLTTIPASASIGITYLGSTTILNITPVVASGSIGVTNYTSPYVTNLTASPITISIGIGNTNNTTPTALTTVPANASINTVNESSQTTLTPLTPVSVYAQIQNSSLATSTTGIFHRILQILSLLLQPKIKESPVKTTIKETPLTPKIVEESVNASNS